MNFCELLPMLSKGLWQSFFVNCNESELFLYLELINYSYCRLDLLDILFNTPMNEIEENEVIIIKNNDIITHDEFPLDILQTIIGNRVVIYAETKCKALKYDLEVTLQAPSSVYNLIQPYLYSSILSLVEWKELSSKDVAIDDFVSQKHKANLEFKKPNFDHPQLLKLQKILQMNIKGSDLPLPQSCLLVGASGSGKSQIAKYLCFEPNYYAMYIYSTEIASKYVGDSEERLRTIFMEAKEKNPTILVFDEFDAICGARGDNSIDDRLMTCLLTEMDGIQDRGKVFIIGCTRDLEKVDSALKRPGRFDLILTI